MSSFPFSRSQYLACLASKSSLRTYSFPFHAAPSSFRLISTHSNSRRRDRLRPQKRFIAATTDSSFPSTTAQTETHQSHEEEEHRQTSTSTLRRPYRFHIAASWAGKPESSKEDMVKVPFSKDSVVGRWRDHILQSNRSKRPLAKDAGEDFFFIQEMRNGSGVAFGVADGVGGWTISGVDPSLFSQSLMYHAHRYSRNAWAGEPEVDPTLDYEEREQIEGWELTPYACLDLAYGGVLREGFVQAGSSTACLLSLNSSSGLLRSANLGDSGFIIIRSSNIIHKNPIQTHYFNCPKQLTKTPEKPKQKKFPQACTDSPSEAETFSTKLRDGDIVIAYTDGLSDNVFINEMVTICSLVARQGGSEEEQVRLMADRMVEYARQSMMSRDKVTPFEREAARLGMFFRGGKVDDVTVVVALVRETS